MNEQQNQQNPQGPTNATLVAYFRRVIEAGPDTILDDYLDHNNPFTFDFSEVQERQRDGSFDTAFSPATASELQEEHDALLEAFDSPAMIRAARVANGMDDPDGRPTIGRETTIREITFGRITMTETTKRPILAQPTEGLSFAEVAALAAGSAPGPLTGTSTELVSTDHDDTTTVDVVLFEEGRERVVHINKRVFGFFQRLRPAMGTLEGYHPETGFEEYDLPGFAAEHAELLATHGVDAMIEGAIAAQVYNDRFTGKRTTLSDIYDNHDDPRDGSRSSDAYDEETLRERVEELEEEVARLKEENEALESASLDEETFYTYHCEDVALMREVQRHLSDTGATGLAAAMGSLIDRVTGEIKPCPFCDAPKPDATAGDFDETQGRG